MSSRKPKILQRAGTGAPPLVLVARLAALEEEQARRRAKHAARMARYRAKLKAKKKKGRA